MSEASLIPMGEHYIKHGFNVLLIGDHGCGKTYSVMQLCKKLDLRYKYYSCSTLDPYTDFTGVPVPRKHDDGKEYLEFIRPKDIDDAELVFFDEFNRADHKTINAIFEIVQFKTINGEPLPNLKCCWAAINPPNKEYQVEDLDPAIVDRFDAFLEIKPKPSVAYMIRAFKTRFPEYDASVIAGVSTGLVNWWKDHNKEKRGLENYISPRRLEKIGTLFLSTKNTQSVSDALPTWGNYEVEKLATYLREAIGEGVESTTSIGKPAADFKYNATNLFREREILSKYLKENPTELETHRKVYEGLKQFPFNAKSMCSSLSELLNSLQPALMESLFNDMSSAKQSQMRKQFIEEMKKDKTKADNQKNLATVLAKGSRLPELKNLK